MITCDSLVLFRRARISAITFVLCIAFAVKIKDRLLFGNRPTYSTIYSALRCPTTIYQPCVKDANHQEWCNVSLFQTH